MSVLCCQAEVSATGWSLVQRSPTDCGVSLCVISKNLKNEEAIAHDWAASAIKKIVDFMMVMMMKIVWRFVNLQGRSDRNCNWFGESCNYRHKQPPYVRQKKMEASSSSKKWRLGLTIFAVERQKRLPRRLLSYTTLSKIRRHCVLHNNSFWGEFICSWQQWNVPRLHVNCPIFFAMILKKILVFRQTFIGVPTFQTSRKSVQWEQPWYVQTDGQTEMTELIGTLFAIMRKHLK